MLAPQKFIAPLAFIAAMAHAKTQVASKVHWPSSWRNESFARSPASETQIAFLYFSSTDPKDKVLFPKDQAKFKTRAQVIYPAAWAALSDERRTQYLAAFARSAHNDSHTRQVCFKGFGGFVANEFFGKDTYFSDLQSEVELSLSEDGQMIGVEFLPLGETDWQSFRVVACASLGKGPGDGPPDQRGLPLPPKNPWPPPPDAGAPPPVSRGANLADGFKLMDFPANGKVPKFRLKADHTAAATRVEKTPPWRGLDLRTDEGRRKFSYVMQAYVYEDLAQTLTRDGKKISTEDIFRPELPHVKRYWCHMPWQNQLPAGREYLHGLTQERQLLPSPSIYPQAKGGSDWGVGFYNAAGCKTIAGIFGSVDAPIDPSDKFSGVDFPADTVSFKVLWTTGNFKASGEFSGIDKAPQWKAHVSEVKSNVRSEKTVRHLQMDIALKAKLPGSFGEINDWLMITYVFDEKFDNRPFLLKYTSLDVKRLAPGFERMKPIGVQLGIGDGQSYIFEKTSKGEWITNQVDGRLNGPADNPKSTCLGCHATAGTSIPMAPGMKSNAEFKKIGSGHLDFSQQLALAKRNFETAPRHSKAP